MQIKRNRWNAGDAHSFLFPLIIILLFRAAVRIRIRPRIMNRLKRMRRIYCRYSRCESFLLFSSKRDSARDLNVAAPRRSRDTTEDFPRVRTLF